MAYEYESKETRVLKTIDSQRYPETNKDFVKNIRRLNSSVDYISSYMRVMQKGIDDANKSFIEQIQSFINDLVVIFAGGEPTGIELGDLKYILQAIGALFGFNGPFPVNLLNAAVHFFEGFLAPITQLSDLIFDAIEAWMLDLIDKAGNIPLIGGAVTSIAQWIIDATNGIQQGIEDAADAFAHAGEIIDSFLRALGVPTFADVEKWFENLFGGLLYGIDFGDGFDLLEAGQWIINVVLLPVNLLAKLVGGFLEGFRIPGLDASKITSGTFAQTMIAGLVDDLGDLAGYIIAIIDSFLRALGVPTFADVEKWFGNLFGGLLYGIDFGDGFDLLEAAQWIINVVLFPVNLIAKLVGGFLEVFRIPGLDASKITSGTFAQSMISGLVDALGNLGKFINDVIDAIEGAFRGIPIIGSGIANLIDGIQQFFNGLFGATTPQPTIQAPAVPGVDASKITTGSFGSGRIGDLAITNAKIADSAVTGAKTSSLDATKVTTGSFGSSRIADFAITNSKLGSLSVATGNLADSAVTGAKTSGLDATKVTTGTFGSSRIADLAIINSKLGNLSVATGNLIDSAVTGAKTSGLDATKITTGQIPASNIAQLTQSKVTGLPTDIAVSSTLTDLTADVADLKATRDVSINQGKIMTINFTTLANSSSLPTTGSQRWSTSYLSSTSGATWGISSGKAAWVGNISGSGAAKIIYLGDGTTGSEKTLTDYQSLRGVLVDAPAIFGGSNTKFTAMARVSDDGNTFVWARAFWSGLTLVGEIGCTVAGAETIWQTNIPLTWSTEMTFRCGNDTNVRTFQVFSGSVLVTTYTDSANTSRLCSANHTLPSQHTTSCVKHRRFGAIATYNGNNTSGTVSSVSVSDNPPVTYAGSVGRMSRVGTGLVNFTAGEMQLGSFFDNLDFESLDIDGLLTDGTFTVTQSKMYAISARIRLSAALQAIATVNLQVLPQGGSTWYTVARGDAVWAWDNLYANLPTPWSLTGSWLQYLNEGEKVRLTVERSNTGGATANVLSGAPAPVAGYGSAETYFAITGLS